MRGRLRSGVRRALLAAARWRPGPSYVVASFADRSRKAFWRLRGVAPASDPFWRRPTAFREWILNEAYMNPTRRWSYPRVISGPDPRALKGPMVLVSFHIGTPQVLGALFERLPGPRLAMFYGTVVPRPGNTVVDVAQNGWISAKRAVDTLRAGGFVFTMADGDGQARVEAHLWGRRIGLPRGTFAIARLAGAPLLPVTARWRGSAIEIVAGDPILPADEAEMAAALVSWLEAYLAEHPEEMRFLFLYLLHRVLLCDGALAEGPLEGLIPDLPGLRPGNGPRLYGHDPIGRKAESVENRP